MSGARVEALPSELVYFIARFFLPTLCTLRTCCKSLRSALEDSPLRAETTLVLTVEEVTLGTCELIATLTALERVLIAQRGDALLIVDVRVLRLATSVCVQPVASIMHAQCRYRSWLAGNESCVWPVTLVDESSLHCAITNEIVGLLCAPILRTNPNLVKLTTRYSQAVSHSTTLQTGQSHIDVQLLRSGRGESWAQVFVSTTRTVSKRPPESLSALLVAGLLAPPHTPLEFRVDLTGLRSVCGAALAYAEARSGRRFVRPIYSDERPASPFQSEPALSPTSLACSTLLAARAVHHARWGIGPNAAQAHSDVAPSSASGGMLRPLLAIVRGAGPQAERFSFGGPAPILLPGLTEAQIPNFVVPQWTGQRSRWWEEAWIAREAANLQLGISDLRAASTVISASDASVAN